MKIPPFDPADLKPIQVLHREEKFPSSMTLRHVRGLCLSGEFPAAKIGQEWHTTEGAIRAWVWKRANNSFKKINH